MTTLKEIGVEFLNFKLRHCQLNIQLAIDCLLYIFEKLYISLKKLILCFFITLSSWLTAFSQYWQQQANFVIDVSLNDKEHTLDGFEKIEYINNSPDTLRFIWFHLWPNAYKNDKTAYSDQALENGNIKFYFSLSVSICYLFFSFLPLFICFILCINIFVCQLFYLSDFFFTPFS